MSSLNVFQLNKLCGLEEPNLIVGSARIKFDVCVLANKNTRTHKKKKLDFYGKKNPTILPTLPPY